MRVLAVLSVFLFSMSALTAPINVYLCSSGCTDAWDGASTTFSNAVGIIESNPDGGVIYISAGTYAISGSTTISVPVQLVGVGMQVTELVFNNDSGPALVLDGGNGTEKEFRIEKLSLLPGASHKASLANGGIKIIGNSKVDLDQVMVYNFGLLASEYVSPDSLDSYCIAVDSDSANLSLINSVMLNCNNGLVINEAGIVDINGTVVHMTGYGSAFYVDANATDTVINVTNSWFAHKKDRTPGEDFSKYLVYLGGGTSQFINSQTELDVDQGVGTKSHHIYVGTNENNFVSHKFVSGENPDAGCSGAPPTAPFALDLEGDNNFVWQYSSISEGCGKPAIHDGGVNNTKWTNYN